MPNSDHGMAKQDSRAEQPGEAIEGFTTNTDGVNCRFAGQPTVTA